MTSRVGVPIDLAAKCAPLGSLSPPVRAQFVLVPCQKFRVVLSWSAWRPNHVIVGRSPQFYDFSVLGREAWRV